MIFLGSEIENFRKPYIVAEISGNHNGDINSAFKLIEHAKEAGADAVKIQCYDADSLTLPTDFKIKGEQLWKGKNLYELYMKTCTPFDWIPKLFHHASQVEIPIFSSVYDERGLEILVKNNCRAYKIASYEAADTKLLGRVLALGKPVVISLGVTNSIEFDRLLEYTNDREDVVLMHCVSRYPCELEDVSLGEIVLLNRICEHPIGFSCHSDNPLAVQLAAAKGAAMIELHLAIDDEVGQTSEDYEFSFTKDTLKYTIDSLPTIMKAMYGTKSKAASTELKRSLYVVKNLKEGDIFTEQNVKSYRPNLGCEPYLLPNIVGRKAACDIPMHSPMKMEYVK